MRLVAFNSASTQLLSTTCMPPRCRVMTLMELTVQCAGRTGGWASKVHLLAQLRIEEQKIMGGYWEVGPE